MYVSGSEIARRFDSPMLSRIATQKAAEHASQAALASVARLKASRAAGPASVSGLTLNCPPGGIEDSSDRVVAYTEQEPEGIPFSEHAARGPFNRNFPQHQIGAWIIVKGWGDNRGQG